MRYLEEGVLRREENPRLNPEILLCRFLNFGVIVERWQESHHAQHLQEEKKKSFKKEVTVSNVAETPSKMKTKKWQLIPQY